MENIYFNLDSIESSYGENVLTSIIQMDERFKDLESALLKNPSVNDFQKQQFADRLNKIAELNYRIQYELTLQQQKIDKVQQNLKPEVISRS